MATTSWPTLSASDSPIAAVGRPGRVDLDDREVGQRVDAVDRAGQDPAVLELDVELLAALDDVVVGQDPAVAVEDDPGPDTGRRDDPVVARIGAAGDGDPHDGRADLGGHRDGRRRLVDGDRLRRPGVRAPGWRPAPALRVGPGRPAAPSARTVPPEARTADRSGAARIGSASATPADSLVTVAAGTGATAGSYQRSGVTGGVSSHVRAQPERGSGAGV